MENKKDSKDFSDNESGLLIKSKLNWNKPEVTDLDVNKTLGGSTPTSQETTGNAAS